MSERRFDTPDSFGSIPGNVNVVDPATGITYTLGVGAGTTPIYVAVSTWARGKQLLGPTWADAKRRATTWGIAKALAGA